MTMEEKTLPKENPIKNKIITFFIVLMALTGSVIFVLEKLFSNFEPTDPVNGAIEQEDIGVFYKGTVKYIPPETYTGENISYELVDNNRETIILLKSKDDKLEVVENLYVTVKGTRTKTLQGDPLLIVTEVVVSN
jgi:hypothetical protein